MPRISLSQCVLEMKTAWVMMQADFDDIEAEFWRVVEHGCPPTQAVCSIDLDSTSSGSGFPQVPFHRTQNATLHLDACELS